MITTYVFQDGRVTRHPWPELAEIPDNMDWDKAVQMLGYGIPTHTGDEDGHHIAVHSHNDPEHDYRFLVEFSDVFTGYLIRCSDLHELIELKAKLVPLIVQMNLANMLRDFRSYDLHRVNCKTGAKARRYPIDAVEALADLLLSRCEP